MNVTDAVIVALVAGMVIFAILRSINKRNSSAGGHCTKCSFKDSCQKYKNKK